MAVLLAFSVVSCSGDEVPGVQPAPTRAPSSEPAALRIPGAEVTPSPARTSSGRDGTSPRDPEVPGVTALKPTRPGSPRAAEIPGVTDQPTGGSSPDVSASGCADDPGCLLSAALAEEEFDVESEGDSEKLAQLRELPSDTAEALQALSGYEWTSTAAKDLYDQARQLAGLD
jgi:hypothetical protein